MARPTQPPLSTDPAKPDVWGAANNACHTYSWDTAEQALTGPVRTVTGNTTLVVGDLGGTVVVNSATPVDVTIPTFAAVPFAVGSRTRVVQLGVGQVTVVDGSSGLDAGSTRGQYSVVEVLKIIASDTWFLSGDVA